MKLQAKRIVIFLLNGALNITFWGCMSLVALILIQIFFVSSFKIPSNSMEPELLIGDNLLVNKLIPGPRLFNVFALLGGEQVKITRLPGIRPIKRNDVVVFNFPHPQDWGKIEMNYMKFYIKRCIALPGDTLCIKNGFYHLTNTDEPVGNQEAQRLLSQQDSQTIEKGVLHCFPYDSAIPWTIKNFGPLYIPRRGDSIPLNRTNAILYRKLIEWEEKAKLHLSGDSVYLDNRYTPTYRFRNNYYFMGGDKVDNSQDSRYWGMLPEEYIVGKAWFIWNSKDATGGVRWKRVLKAVH